MNGRYKLRLQYSEGVRAVALNCSASWIIFHFYNRLDFFWKQFRNFLLLCHPTLDHPETTIGREPKTRQLGNDPSLAHSLSL